MIHLCGNIFKDRVFNFKSPVDMSQDSVLFAQSKSRAGGLFHCAQAITALGGRAMQHFCGPIYETTILLNQKDDCKTILIENMGQVGMGLPVLHGQIA